MLDWSDCNLQLLVELNPAPKIPNSKFLLKSTKRITWEIHRKKRKLSTIISTLPNASQRLTDAILNEFSTSFFLICSKFYRRKLKLPKFKLLITFSVYLFCLFNQCSKFNLGYFDALSTLGQVILCMRPLACVLLWSTIIVRLNVYKMKAKSSSQTEWFFNRWLPIAFTIKTNFVQVSKHKNFFSKLLQICREMRLEW